MALREIIGLLGYRIDRQTEKSALRSLNNIRTTAATAIGTVLGFGFRDVARGLKNALTETVGLASDAIETANQLEAVFGDIAPLVRGRLDQIAKDTNRSRFEMQKFGAQAGALLKPLLGSADAAAEMASDVVSLTADMSSFFNLTQEATLEKFRAGLIGSSEPLISLGIDVRETALSTFALSKGITKSTKAMSTAEKTALRFDLIVSKLGEQGAIGDATKTAFLGANAFRGFGQGMIDIKTVVGKFFLPAITDSVNGLTRFVRRLEESIMKGGKARRILKFLADAFKGMGLGVRIVLQNLKTIIPGLLILIAIISPMTALVLILAAAFAVFAEELNAFDDPKTLGFFEGVTNEFKLMLKELGSVSAALEKLFENAVEFWVKQLAEFRGQSLKEFKQDIVDTLGFLIPGIGRSRLTESAGGTSAGIVTQATVRDLGTIGTAGRTVVGDVNVQQTITAAPGMSVGALADQSANRVGEVVDARNRQAFSQLVPE